MNQPQLLQDDQPIDSVEDYRFEPIKGYPMLNWRGKRPFTATQYFPAQHKETHGQEVDGWRNKIYWGDNLQVMSHLLKEYRGEVQLVYIDPPFDSKADYKKKINLRGNTIGNDHGLFEEKQYTDIWTNDEYLQFMYERLTIIRELLASNGSIYLHCDNRMVSHLRIIIDEIYGSGSVHNIICWKSSPGHSDAALYGQMQNTIIFASCGESPIWNLQYQPYDEEYLSTHYQKQDEDGRLFEDDNLTAYGLSGGGYTYEWNGVTKLWRCPISKMQSLHDNGRLYYTKNGVARYKRYLDEMQGSPISDLWLDIPRLNSQALEKENYPTQKPEALLERIIRVSSNPGDLVFDCFMGSGTTQSAAMKMGRRFLGADINLGAVQTTTKRLISVGQGLGQETTNPTQPTLALDEENNAPAEPTTFYTGFDVYNVNHYDIFRNPVEARDLLLEALEVNRLAETHLFDGEKDGRMIKLMPVNQIATKANLNDLLANLDYNAFQRRKAEHPNQPVEKITLICMGHEPDLAAVLKHEVKLNGFDIDVEVVDILRDKQELQFKYEAEADINVRDGQLIIDAFYPLNLLNKLSLQAENVEEWRELVESIMIDWNYDGAILQPALVDIPAKNELVQGTYPIPADAGTIRVKITDLLSESLEIEVFHG